MSDNKVALKQTGVAGVDPLIDTEQLTVGGNVVERQRVEVAGASAAEIARVIQNAPAGTEFALVVRPIPSGTQDVNVVGGNVTLQAADIEIGAVEVKNATTDDRLSISAAGAAKVDGSAVTQPVSAASLPLPAGAATEATLDARTGALTEAAPGTDTASSGLNGRLQRIAQRLTSLIALLPAALGQTTKAASLSVALASDQTVPVAGDVASGAADSGNPVKVGGVGRQTLPTAVTDGQRVDAMNDDLGRRVVVPHAVRDLCGDQQTALTSTTSVTTIVTADANNMLDLVGLILANTSATGSIVTLYNDDGTTVRAIFYCPPTDTRGIVFAVPLKQTAVNKAWKLKTTTSIASLQVTAQFVKNQ
jgi:hypothetical protein